MKKATLILSIIALFGSVLSSCKMREKCPAYGTYGKVSTNVTIKKPC